MDKKEIFLSVIIPAYNEEDRIPQTLRKIFDYVEKKGYPFEIIVVDDGSRDHTFDAIEHFLSNTNKDAAVMRLDTNRGKGYAVRKGILFSSGRYMLITDADLSTPIEELDKLLAAAQGGFDLVIGSRGLDRSLLKFHQPWYREILGRIFNLLVQFIVIKGIIDTQCGFKVVSENARKIFRRSLIDDFSYDVEVLYLARKMGYRIKEVPVVWINSPHSKVKLYKDPVKMLFSLFRIRLNDLFGHY